jgi:hypothetical protein
MKTLLTTTFTIAAVLSLALVEPPPAAAQSRELQRRLQAATRIDCKFSQVATVDWDSGAPEAKAAPAEREATFHEIDIDGGTAESGSDYGDSFISVRYSQGYLHFMQTSDVGPLWITTVLAMESENGRMKAVHTRLEYAATTLPGFATRPEMYFGDCEVM